MAFLPIGATTLYFEIDEASDPNAPALLLSNSLGTNLAMWDAQALAWAGRFRLIRYDTRGHGRSVSLGAVTSFAELGRDVLALLDHLDIARAHFCGLSMGGMTGMWLAANAPQRLDRLVLCNTAARIGPASIWDARIAQVREHGMAAVAPGVIARWFTPAFIESQNVLVQPILDMLLGTSPSGYIACCEALRAADFTAELAGIGAPTLVVAGRLDPATTVADALALASHIAGAQVIELNAAHLSNIEDMQEYNRAVQDFLLGATNG